MAVTLGRKKQAEAPQPAEPENDHIASRDALVMEHLPLVKYIAYKIFSRLPSTSKFDVEDLINNGIIGLIDAADRFDPERNLKFSTFAEHRIRGEILDRLRNMERVPRTSWKNKRKIDAAIQAIEQEKCRAATDEEIAEHLGISLDELYATLDELKGISLGIFADSETADGENIIDIIPDPDTEDPHLRLQESEVRKILKDAISKLPDNQRDTVEMYYFHELNMKEIGEKLNNISESRVSQLHTKAMLRLRKELRNQPVSGR
ncbi:MAG: FliA/WhiG family RNA polymerase sigma factor [Holophagales bacterium]|jgi:RNA polymerase sigma factor for flagellar operon FliA|nr:FliA/WhiG family RNA polymerase sigma factor [Holophagales bacterium]